MVQTISAGHAQLTPLPNINLGAGDGCDGGKWGQIVHDGKSEIRTQKVASVLALWVGLAPAKVKKHLASSSKEPLSERRFRVAVGKIQLPLPGTGKTRRLGALWVVMARHGNQHCSGLVSQASVATLCR